MSIKVLKENQAAPDAQTCSKSKISGRQPSISFANRQGVPCHGTLHRIADLERRLHHGMPLSSIAAAANLVEEDKLFRISLELPGIDAKDVDASVSDSALTIKAEKKNEREEHGQSYYLREREYGRSND